MDIRGNVRSMEPADEMAVLKLRPPEVGLLREDPLHKWLSGQEKYDRKFHRAGKRALRRRIVYQAKAAEMLERAREQGFELVRESACPSQSRHMSIMSVTSSAARIEDDRRWGPLDLEDEPNVPPSAIAKRTDTVTIFDAETS